MTTVHPITLTARERLALDYAASKLGQSPDGAFVAFLSQRVLDQADSKPDGRSEWVDMPAFDSEKLDQRKIVMQFRDDDSVGRFARLVGQTITPSTKSLWYPALELPETQHKRFVSTHAPGEDADAEPVDDA